jgi:hypothetical protein
MARTVLSDLQCLELKPSPPRARFVFEARDRLLADSFVYFDPRVEI